MPPLSYSNKSHEMLALLPFLGTLVCSLVDMMGTADPTMVKTVQLVEYSRPNEWLPCGRKTNGKGGLVQFTVAIILGSSPRDMMGTVVQIMARNVLPVMKRF